MTVCSALTLYASSIVADKTGVEVTDDASDNHEGGVARLDAGGADELDLLGLMVAKGGAATYWISLAG